MLDPPIIKRNGSLRIPLLASLAVHIFVFAIGSLFPNSQEPSEQDLLSIRLVYAPPPETPPPRPKEMKKPKESPPAGKTAVVKPEPPTPLPPAPVKKEPSKVEETKTAAPAKVENAPSFTSSASVEGGGSEAGAGNLLDVGVVPGTGTAGGGGGTATAGLGRGSGAPGLPIPTPLKTDREARPVKTVRTNYPPMALHMGMEGDVTLRIEVDAEGKVTKAEIINSGGIGFDEEALKAVNQSRFEPAQVDGKNVPAEFTYIYRFRLRR